MELRNVLVGASIVGLSMLSTVSVPVSYAEEAVIEEVIVTASRRSESIQDSSLIVEALTGDQLSEQGILNMPNLGMAVPSLQIGAAGPALQIYMRGVGSGTATSFGHPAIAVSKDGSYIARVPSIASHFFDLERVEVLKGPQGTLYGRNATGGAVNLITRRPDLEEVSGYVSADIGDYNKIQLEGAVNIPFSETFAARISAISVDRDGYMSDGTSDDEHYAARLQTLWEPNDRLSWRVQGQFAKYDGRGQGFSYAGAPDAWTSLYPSANAILAANGPRAPSVAFPWITTAPVLGPAPTPPFPPGTNFISLVNFIEDDITQDMTFWDVSTEFEYDFDLATLTLVASHQEAEIAYISRPSVRFEIGNELDGKQPEEPESLSIEARLSAETDTLKWVVGANLFREEQTIFSRVNQGVIQNLQIQSEYETDGLGVFGELNYSLSDTARLIVGLRYSDDELEKPNFYRWAVGDSVACPPPRQQIVGGVVACLTSGPESESISFDNVDWKLGFEYDVSEDVMLFATMSTGYKSGGLPAVSGPGYDEEELDAYTLGLKSTLLDGRVQLNAEVFYWDYTGRQEAAVGPDATGIIGLNTYNAGDSTIQGVAFDVQWAVTANDFFRLNFEYLDAEYEDFSFTQAAQFTPPTTCSTAPTGANVPTPGGTSPELLIDCSGFEMTRSPDISYSADYVHTFPLDSNGEIDVRLNVSYTDERWLSANFLAEQRVDEYMILNAYVSYRSADARLSVTAYLENATEDEAFHTSLNHTQVPALIGLMSNPPRTYGLRVRYNF